MPRWPETESDVAIALIKHEWEIGVPAFLIARHLGKTWKALDVIAIASKKWFRRPWTRRNALQRVEPQ